MDSEAKDLISDILSETGTKVDMVPLSPGVSMTGTGEVNRSRVTISNERGSFTFVHYESGYNMLYGERDDGTDIFISAILDAQIVGTGISFEDYCEENGYDEDGKELAKKTYDGLMKANTKLRSMFEDDIYSHLCRLAEETV